MPASSKKTKFLSALYVAGLIIGIVGVILLIFSFWGGPKEYGGALCTIALFVCIITQQQLDKARNGQ